MTENPFRIVIQDNPNFIRYCLAMSILCTAPLRNCERDEFIKFCQGNNLLQYVSQFDLHYRPDETIQWYTRPSGFPSKFVNTICRTQHPLLISKVRYYLKHLHEHLTRLYQDSLFWIPQFIIVYRGQRFSSAEYQKLVQYNEKPILTTTYLSTTSAYNIAVEFSGYNIRSNASLQDEISVIFKIVIQTKNTRLKPFAYIQEYSHVRDEKEILISMGTIFSFVNIYKRGILLIHGQSEEEMEKKILYKAIESYGNERTMTIGNVLISMNIPSTLDDDFYCRPLTSLLEEYLQIKPENIVNSVSTESQIMTIQDWPEGVTNDHLIIWVDTFIGENNTCIEFKDALANAIKLIKDEIDRLIVNNEIYPLRRELITLRTIEECLEMIDINRDKKIFLITSGSLGLQLVPRVLNTFPCVEKIYIFCGYIRGLVDWAMDFTDKLLMFDFPNDLFARVVYDIGMYYMERAINFSNSNEHISALYYLYYCKTLVMRTIHIFHSYLWFSLTPIDEYIAMEESLLPKDMVQHVRHNVQHV
ncbi:unnamed protein product [Rotaria sp. Silwood2]|nr:unnamed protein product [Rotaria sp. Silwood2]